MCPRILIVDGDSIVRDSLSELLQHTGYQTKTADRLDHALERLEQGRFQVVISEVNLPDSHGFELLRALGQRHPDVVTILITAYGTIESAVDAIKLGAYDYLTKPIIDEEIKLTVERALQQQALISENQVLRAQLHDRQVFGNIVGQDYKMAKVFDLIETVADSRVNVLITGESGTGKSLIARALHHKSTRHEAPFVEVNCGAIPEALLESELFGHARGAFTGAVQDKEGKFAAADGGTLFLDEIAAASAGLQVKLLRVLQERQFEPVGSNTTRSVDVRVILATNVDLDREVQVGRFRRDLYYRINVVNIALPPLAHRLSDIGLLAQHFLEKYNREFHKRVRSIDEHALHVMHGYRWPGNVRELENVIERAVVLSKTSILGVDDLPPHMKPLPALPQHPDGLELQSLQKALEEPERLIIEAALKAHNWNRQATAEALQINRTTLYKKMKRYGLGEPALSRRS